MVFKHVWKAWSVWDLQDRRSLGLTAYSRGFASSADMAASKYHRPQVYAAAGDPEVQ